jgi:hypothetical protein
MTRVLNAVVRSGALLLALGVTYGGLPACASPVVYDFTGTATNDSGWGPVDVGAVHVGDPITGSFHYDSGMSGTASPGGGGTSYLGDVGLTVTMGPVTFDFGSPQAGGVGVSHSALGAGDSFTVSVEKNINPVTGTADFAEIVLHDPTATAFADESLPPSLDLTKFADAAIEVIAADGSFYSGPITLTPPPQAVPEPATVAVFLLGVGAFAARRKGVRPGSDR